MIETTPASARPCTARPPLRLGDIAPDFTARSTMGPVSLSQYRGRWLLFFSHPADFTPVCTSEFVALARQADSFAALDCALLGLSVDSLHAHIAWAKAIEAVHGVAIPFPIVEDPSMAIGKAYGMIDEAADDSSAIRSTFVIDPAGVVRAITAYPHNVGRNVAELLRLVAALRTVHDNDVLTPEGWQAGDAVMRPPPTHIADTASTADWFCRADASGKEQD